MMWKRPSGWLLVAAILSACGSRTTVNGHASRAADSGTSVASSSAGRAAAGGSGTVVEHGGTAITNAFRGVMQDRSSRSPEEALFVEKCSMCHRQMGMGTVLLARRMDPVVAMLEKRDNLTEPFVVQAVRNGIGNMPRVQRGEVSDAQLETIARYLARRTR